MSLTRYLNRTGTAAEWSSANPVLGPGEIGHESDTDLIKIGDGLTTWNSLQYVGSIPDNSLTTIKLVDNVITTAKIQDSAISSAKIATNAITETKIADNSVSNAKLQTGAVTAAILGTNSVSASKIQTDAISTGKIQNLAITGEKIATSAITSDKLVDDIISTSKLQNDSITSTKLAIGSITGEKIVSDTITEDKLSSAVRTKLNTSSTGGTSSDYSSLINSDIILDSTYKGKILKIFNETDITVTVSSGLTEDMSFGFHKIGGSGQLLWDFSQVTVEDNINFSPTISNEAIGSFVALSADTYNYIPGSDVEQNSAPVTSPIMSGTFQEGETVTIQPNITDADGDTLDTPEYRHFTSDDNTGTNEVQVASTQAWTIPTGGTYVNKYHRADVLPKAVTGVKTGVRVFTPFNIIIAEAVSNLWLPTDDASTVFWLSSLLQTYNNLGGTTAAAVDDPVNGLIRSWRDQEGAVLGTEDTNPPSLISAGVSQAVRFSGDALLNFGNQLDVIVNQQSVGNHWAVVALYNMPTVALAVNALISKKNASDQGMLIRLNANRRKIQLADGEAQDIIRQNDAPANVVGTYASTFRLQPGAANVADRIRIFDAGFEHATNDAGSVSQGTGVSDGSSSVSDLLIGGLTTVDFNLYELAIFLNPTDDTLRKAESAFIYRHGLENGILNPSTGTFVTGGLVAGHTYAGAAPTNT